MEAQMTTTETSLEMKRVFQAPVALVYRAWTEPEMMNEWFHPGAEMVSTCTADLRVGGRYEVIMHHPSGKQHVVGGEYREIVPQRKLVFTWRWQGDAHETVVTVLFRALNPSETELTLRHEHFTDAAERDNHAMGWEGTLVQLEESL